MAPSASAGRSSHLQSRAGNGRYRLYRGEPASGHTRSPPSRGARPLHGAPGLRLSRQLHGRETHTEGARRLPPTGDVPGLTVPPLLVARRPEGSETHCGGWPDGTKRRLPPIPVLDRMRENKTFQEVGAGIHLADYETLLSRTKVPLAAGWPRGLTRRLAHVQLLPGSARKHKTPRCLLDPGC